MSPAEHLPAHFCFEKPLSHVIINSQWGFTLSTPRTDYLWTAMHSLLANLSPQHFHTEKKAFKGFSTFWFPMWGRTKFCWCCRTSLRCSLGEQGQPRGAELHRKHRRHLCFLGCFKFIWKPINLKLQWQLRFPPAMESRLANFSHHALCKQSHWSWVYSLGADCQFASGHRLFI